MKKVVLFTVGVAVAAMFTGCTASNSILEQSSSKGELKKTNTVVIKKETEPLVQKFLENKSEMIFNQKGVERTFTIGKDGAGMSDAVSVHLLGDRAEVSINFDYRHSGKDWNRSYASINDKSLNDYYQNTRGGATSYVVKVDECGAGLVKSTVSSNLNDTGELKQGYEHIFSVCKDSKERYIYSQSNRYYYF